MIPPAILQCLPDYSWDDIAKAAKSAMVAAALGGTTLTINGREIARITIDQAKTLYDLARQEAAAEQTAGDAGSILVQFSPPARMGRRGDYR